MRQNYHFNRDFHNVQLPKQLHRHSKTHNHTDKSYDCIPDSSQLQFCISRIDDSESYHEKKLIHASRRALSV